MLNRRGDWRLVVAAVALLMLGYLLRGHQTPTELPGADGTGIERSVDRRITKQSFSSIEWMLGGVSAWKSVGDPTG